MSVSDIAKAAREALQRGDLKAVAAALDSLVGDEWVLTAHSLPPAFSDVWVVTEDGLSMRCYRDFDGQWIRSDGTDFERQPVLKWRR